MPPTSFARLSILCKNLEATSKRKEKKRLLAEFLRNLEPGEVAPAVLLVVGTVFPEFDSRVLEVGWRTVKRVLDGSRQTSLLVQPLTIEHVYSTLVKISEVEGPGSRKLKEGLLQSLINQSEPSEAEILVRIIFGEMRIGVSELTMLEGIANAVDVDANLVRRALMMTGDLGKVAEVALGEGKVGLENLRMKIFTPLKPMLASMSYDIAEVIETHGGETAFEFKLDGARIQIHRQGDEVRIFSRRLSDVTNSLPDIKSLILNNLGSEDIVIEGEAVAIGREGKPLPFQDLMRRFRRVHDIEGMIEKIPLKLYLFDILYLDGELLVDEPYHQRRKLLEEVSPRELLVKQMVTGDPVVVERLQEESVMAGHEGIIAKRLDSIYSPGKRGKLWFKIKPTETLDLVIIAADWGYGRRTGWLSNYHLAVGDGNEFVVIGKTFKGLTDEEFVWMTKRLIDIKVRETQGTVHVLPELVVEVAFNEIQKSPHYQSGFALRFARITRIREDKVVNDADTIEKVRALYEAQFKYKAKTEF